MEQKFSQVAIYTKKITLFCCQILNCVFVWFWIVLCVEQSLPTLIRHKTTQVLFDVCAKSGLDFEHSTGFLIEIQKVIILEYSTRFQKYSFSAFSSIISSKTIKPQMPYFKWKIKKHKMWILFYSSSLCRLFNSYILKSIGNYIYHVVRKFVLPDKTSCVCFLYLCLFLYLYLSPG